MRRHSARRLRRPRAALAGRRDPARRAPRGARRCWNRRPAFRALPPTQQLELARNMVRWRRTWPIRDGLAEQELTPGQRVLASGRPERPRARLADAVDAGQEQGLRQDRHVRAAATSRPARCGRASSSSRSWSSSVDFPEFVGGLIQNVFQAIVDASIQQMHAYGELIETSRRRSTSSRRTTSRRTTRATGWPTSFPTQLGASTQRAAPRRRRRPAPRLVAERQRRRGAAQHQRASCSSPSRSPTCPTPSRKRGSSPRRGCRWRAVAPAAAVLDGDARHQPHRGHRRRDQRQGGVRHARDRQGAAQVAASLYDTRVAAQQATPP